MRLEDWMVLYRWGGDFELSPFRTFYRYAVLKDPQPLVSMHGGGVGECAHTRDPEANASELTYEKLLAVMASVALPPRLRWRVIVGAGFARQAGIEMYPGQVLLPGGKVTLGDTEYCCTGHSGMDMQAFRMAASPELH